MRRTEESFCAEPSPIPHLCPTWARFWALRNGSDQTPFPGSSQSGEAGIVLHHSKHQYLGLWAAAHEG